MRIKKSYVTFCLLAFCLSSVGRGAEITLQTGLYETTQPGYGFVNEGIDSDTGQLVFHDVRNSLRSDLIYGPTGNEIQYAKISTVENIWQEVTATQLLRQCPVTFLTATAFIIYAKDCLPQNGQDFIYNLVH